MFLGVMLLLRISHDFHTYFFVVVSNIIMDITAKLESVLQSCFLFFVTQVSKVGGSWEVFMVTRFFAVWLVLLRCST